MNYARYLMEIHLGRKLNSNEIVHHKDENLLNDSIDNLEVKFEKEHRKLHTKGRTYLTFVCEQCKKEFKRWKNNNHKPIYCSKRCARLENQSGKYK